MADRSSLPVAIKAEGTEVYQDLWTIGDRGHAFTLEGSPNWGGKGRAPGPMSIVLGSLSASMQTTAALVAKDLGITLGSWAFEVRGDLDVSVLIRGAEGTATYERVAVTTAVQTDADDEQFAELIAETTRRCPVTQLYERAGMWAFENTWYREPLTGTQVAVVPTTPSPKPNLAAWIVTAAGDGLAQTIITTTGERKHSFATDNYAELGGEDAAPSPMVCALGSLTSCNQVAAAIVANGLDIALGKWTFEATVELNSGVLLAGGDGGNGFDKIAVRAVIETDASEARFARFVSETERRCPITQLFKRSGLSYENDWRRAPLPE